MAPVSMWERLKGVFARETTDVKEGLRDLGASLDEALANKERELAADPGERFDMTLEDVAAANQELDDLLAPREEGSPEGDARGATASHRLLEPADVSSSPHLLTALRWVTVEPTQDSDPMCGRCDHAAWLEHRATPLIDRELDNVAAAVAGHPLVNEVIPGDTDVLYVSAPTLHHEDVRLLVAGAIADHLPADWRTTTPPDLSI